MAGKRKKRIRTSGRSAEDIDRTTLPGAFRFALQRLAALEGGYAKLARAIQIDSSKLRAWSKRGPGRALLADARAFSETLSVLYARLAWWDRTEQTRGRREEILELSKLPDAHRRLYAEELKKQVEAVNAIDRAMRRRQRGYQVVAARLGPEVTATMVRGWIRRGMVARESLADVVRSESMRGFIRSATNRKTMRHLMSLARKPGTRLTGRRAPDGGPELGPAERIAPFRSERAAIDSPARSGYRWSRHVGSFLDEAVIAEMVAFARSVRLPREYVRSSRRWNRWMVTAVLVEWSPPEAPERRSDRSDKNVVRQFGRDGPADGGGTEQDRELGADMVINQGRSGAACARRADAIATFERRMRDWLGEPFLSFVQGVVVAHWRDRTAEEWSELVRSRRERHAALGRARAQSRRRPAKKKKRRRQPVPRAIDVLEEEPPPQPGGHRRRARKKGKRRR